ncbi:ABC transporter ATP-binding protein [Frankia sp. AgB1.9]|uniref:ABC transporter ATP-binding protein n=1 Tax=unclassified Frankia TaxID=2632575 RepID=UPI0019332A8F|nr:MULTISPECIES: ABC transporter ATP-binding protein [unclassified Frankia]MBL7492192.1 ABC transporter ATP-binding protein [Frankia sp. AgW1.1]MBL7552132.1 ABC transporter ATP-binding protein [Frankia sp. AgB1.9]MBL7622149.1 ABC transporter ATP-binding protein [Frankia sp. AgB1.8]
MDTATVAGAEPDQPALAARSLYRFFRAGDEETLALRGVSLAVAPGEILAVAGPSGSGKSTLLACLAGTDEPDGGTVLVGGQRLSHRLEADRTRLRARLIGLLFQSSNLLAHLTVAQNVQLARRLARGAGRTPTEDLLGQLGIGRRARAYPAQLSGGELARAGLAVALANDPVVLLADEPTGELDLATERDVLALLRARARSGIAVVIASHSPAVAAAADRVLTLTDGRLARETS